MKSRLIFVLIVLCFLPSVSAEIFIAQLNEVYNVGDEINAQITLIPNNPVVDHFLVDLVCGDVKTNIFNQYFNLQTGQQQALSPTTLLNEEHFTLETPINITSNFIGSNSTTNSTENSTRNVEIIKFENCFLSVLYGSESGSSNNFKVSQKVFVEFDVNLDKFNPGDEVFLTGTAEKESELPINGFFEVDVDTLGVHITGTISEGNIDLSFIVPEDGISGKHNITIRVYETNNVGEISNEGFFSNDFRVNQILTDLEIFVNFDSISPVDKFSYKVNSYDQADDIIQEDISVVIYQPKDIVYLKKLIKPNEDQEIKFSLNNTPGYWKIEASAGKLEIRKLFYVEEVQKIQTSLINNTLIVTNIGNVLYEGPLEITIGTIVEVKQLSLNVGETQKFKLRAPDGDYQITINDGSEPSVLGTTFLTGNAIKITDVREGYLEIVGNPLIWWSAIILFVLVVVLVYLKRNVFGKKRKDFIKTGENNSVVENKNSSGILHGSKEKAHVIAITSKSEKDAGYVTQTVNKALIMAKESGAKVYIDGDYKIVVLSPKLTRKTKNETTAVIIAKRIEEILLDHNKRYKEKIVFGIGVNSGEIISEIDGSQFKFTTINNLISAAKRIAHGKGMKVLLSNLVHREISGTVKTKKEGDYWKIDKIVDRSQHKGFLDKFKKSK
jgi:hypothetical protein